MENGHAGCIGHPYLSAKLLRLERDVAALQAERKKDRDALLEARKAFGKEFSALVGRFADGLKRQEVITARLEKLEKRRR